LTSTFSLTPQQTGSEIWSSAGTRYYDENDNLVAEESSSDHSTTVTKTITELDADAIEVVNNAGTELPDTGGMGTTIFYVIGGLLVLAAAIILITRRRVQQ